MYNKWQRVSFTVKGWWGHWLGHHCKKNYVHRQIHIRYWIATSFCCHGSTTPSGPGPPYYSSFLTHVISLLSVIRTIYGIMQTKIQGLHVSTVYGHIQALFLNQSKSYLKYISCALGYHVEKNSSFLITFKTHHIR